MDGVMVEAVGLARHFEARVAVQGMSLSVQAGEILSLLGPNGAGKTTTFRMIAGLLLPTSGTVTIAGERLGPETGDRVRRRVGLLTEAAGLWERLTVRVNLATYARLFGVPEPESRARLAMEAVGVIDRAEDRAGALSKGLKQRVAIARAIVHDPPVVLLDEPTAGLDPASARQLRDLILRLRAEGRAVLVSTHNLAEADELSDRIAVMNTRLLACDTPRALRERQRITEVELDVEDGIGPWAGVLERVGVTVASRNGDHLVVRVPHELAVADLVAALVSAGARLSRVAPRERSLEETYLDLVRPDA